MVGKHTVNTRTVRLETGLDWSDLVIVDFLEIEKQAASWQDTGNLIKNSKRNIYLVLCTANHSNIMVVSRVGMR